MDGFHQLRLLGILLALAVANTSPVLATRLFGDRYEWPLDFGIKLPDGRPLFGASKTLRGLVAAIACTTALAPLFGLHPIAGMELASAAMLGDLLSSFVKRRLNRPPHSQSFGIDQIPESLLPMILFRDRLALSGIDVGELTLAFLIFEMMLSRIFYELVTLPLCGGPP